MVWLISICLSTGYQEVNFFKGQVNFQAAFGSSNSSGNTSVGDGVLQPEAMSPYATKTQTCLLYTSDAADE